METGEQAVLQERYGGRFVALRDGQVVESAPTNRDLLDKIRARKLDLTELTFTYVRPEDRICAY